MCEVAKSDLKEQKSTFINLFFSKISKNLRTN